MPDPAHILVVDDDQRLRDLLREYLTQNDYLVTTAADAAEARARLVGLEFDLIVLDVMMPGENGLELTASLRSSSQVPILLLTAMGEAGDRIAGLESGADDYLAKPFEPRELLLRIGSVLRRAAPPAEAAGKISFGDYSFDPQRGELRDVEQPVKLTSGEVALLRLFARRPGQTVSRRELSQQSGGASERAIDVQITRLRRKIEPDPRNPRYLQTVWGEGYVLWPD
ncbi:MAG: response regulator [Alphaproteobacteria bacterium]|jgi:two-component system phosphate regulon response regulator OmpR|nr:response regulator [Alphaproteobacteria bacterium]HJP20459.1 response regulator [Alphaproteobacteria bacterium]